MLRTPVVLLLALALLAAGCGGSGDTIKPLPTKVKTPQERYVDDIDGICARSAARLKTVRPPNAAAVRDFKRQRYTPLLFRELARWTGQVIPISLSLRKQVEPVPPPANDQAVQRWLRLSRAETAVIQAIHRAAVRREVPALKAAFARTRTQGAQYVVASRKLGFLFCESVSA